MVRATLRHEGELHHGDSGPGGGTTTELQVPHDEQLEIDVLAALAREGDCRELFEWLVPSDFYRHRWVYERLRDAHERAGLRCEIDDAGTGHRWRGLDVAAERCLNRVCRTARTLGSRARAAESLREIARSRAEMEVSAELFNALGRGDEDAAAAARARLLELELEVEPM